MSSELSFLSQELKVGDPPSLVWDRFDKPQLRRFPPTTFKYVEYLGDGVDGQVVRVEADGHPEPLVLKFFFDRAQRPDTERPGYLFHFAFERECINGALLELITASVKQAKATGRRIYLDWNATTWNDAVCNLTAFSIDKGDRYDHATLEAEGLKVFPANGEDEATLKSINSCLGWMELDSDEVERELGPLRWEFPHYNREADEGVLDRDLPRGKVFCLVYRFVPEEGPMDLKYIMRQADFFHAVGFDFHGSEFKGNNWRGKGVLVDMSDIVSMNDRAWDDDAYAWYHKGFAKATEYTLGEMAEGLEFG